MTKRERVRSDAADARGTGDLFVLSRGPALRDRGLVDQVQFLREHLAA